VTTDLSHLRNIHDLVAGAQAGDPQAMEDLISAVRPGVFQFCRSRLGSYSGGPEAADDVAQETCVAIYKIVSRYQDKGAPFTALVYAIAANKVADAQRRFSRSALLVDEIPDCAEPSLGPEDVVMAAVHVRAAHELIGRLPARMRDVLLLRANGASVEHVAEGLGMTAGAVRVAHHRAIARLRQLVIESEEHSELFPPGMALAEAS
jgi:RNA polymerase sigma-70 factor (ECF subfamily)